MKVIGTVCALIAAGSLVAPGTASPVACASPRDRAVGSKRCEPKWPIATVLRKVAQAYEQNKKALLAKDSAAVLAQRGPDFVVVTPDGVNHGAAEMADATRNLLRNVQRWQALSFEVLSIDQTRGDIAVEIRQHSIRLQNRDGRLRRIENWVTQRETWIRTPGGLRVTRVDNIRDQVVSIDGVRRT